MSSAFSRGHGAAPPMKRVETALPEVALLEPRRFEDARGWFQESYRQDSYAALGVEVPMVQSNVSSSSRGVLRGLHYQWPNPQGKLVSALAGEIYDVAVDIRRGSPTFGQWVGAVLSAENGRQLWIPGGFAHGFAVLSEDAVVLYHCSALYSPADDAALAWNDPDLAIDWPVSAPILSAKDATAPRLADVPTERLPTP